MTQAFGLLTPPLGMSAMTARGRRYSAIAHPELLHLMMIPILVVCFRCALAPWTVLAIPRLLVPAWL